MAGTFVETPSRALTIEHEPTGRALAQFKPEEARNTLEEIQVLAAYGAKLRDDGKLRELAIAKIETVVDIVDWIDRNMQPEGKPKLGQARQGMPMIQIMETLGYTITGNGSSTISRWRKLAKEVQQDTDAAVEKIVNGWKMRAGMLAPPEPKEKKDAGDRDLAVEAIFRAYTKLDPDQRIELKQKIMDFEKSYKDPFAFKAA